MRPGCCNMTKPWSRKSLQFCGVKSLGLDAASAGRFSTKSVSDIAEEVRREHSDG
jgi:hypothetical protein